MISLVGLAHTFDSSLWSSVSASVTKQLCCTYKSEHQCCQKTNLDVSSANGKTRLNRTTLPASGMLVCAAAIAAAIATGSMGRTQRWCTGVEGLCPRRDNDSLQCVCRQIRCKHVLVTVPISVLQREDITFAPPLPQLKRQAIQRVKMSNAIKVTLQQTALLGSCSG